ncbi:MAG TPA: L-threonylcarbamoyladenylate synthase [Gemmataceae bacterium]|nr:L-threonylcarbamoyladenylate synthase [Gemmataceae bacterium]
MRTDVLRVDRDAPAPEAVARAAAVLRAGGLVALPTETVYGLAANALDPAAVARIFAAKGRPANNPLIVHAADPDAARRVAADWPGAAEELAARFWPGPLTLVLPKQDLVPDVVTAGGPTVAVRVPAHSVALAVIRAAGVPVAAPSANPSSQLSPTCAEHVLRGLGGRIEMILDAGPTAAGVESTVLDLTASPPRLLRPGPVTPVMIEAVIGPVEVPAHLVASAGEPLRSPGLLGRHYAPRAALEVADGDGRERAEELARSGQRVGWLTFGVGRGQGHPRLTAVVMPRDPAEYAARLYAVLHELDAAGVERVVVARPPEGPGWLAVRDRLRRAAAE